jgi:hypothetical protein
VFNLFAERLDGQVVERSFATGLLSLLEHAAGIGNDALAGAEELAVSGNLLGLPLLGAEALDLLHATAG